MLESALLIRWVISIIVIILLIAAFYLLLKILKEKGLNANSISLKTDLKANRMKIIDQLYLDSKNKIVKIKDGDEEITVLVGTGSQILKKDK